MSILYALPDNWFLWSYKQTFTRQLLACETILLRPHNLHLAPLRRYTLIIGDTKGSKQYRRKVQERFKISIKVYVACDSGIPEDSNVSDRYIVLKMVHSLLKIAIRISNIAEIKEIICFGLAQLEDLSLMENRAFQAQCRPGLLLRSGRHSPMVLGVRRRGQINHTHINACG